LILPKTMGEHFINWRMSMECTNARCQQAILLQSKMRHLHLQRCWLHTCKWTPMEKEKVLDNGTIFLVNEKAKHNNMYKS
jgi:hypothetical protein